MPFTDTRLGKEPTYTANLKRSHIARVEDTARPAGQVGGIEGSDYVLGVPMSRLTTMLAGAAAGVLATAAMTVTMRMLFPWLPKEDRYELPPRMLIDSALPEPLKAGDEDLARARLALLGHVSYGAATGAVYALTGERQALGSLPRGAACGVGVWALSYLGWIPAVGLLRPATRHPADRNALMIAAHLVWGAALAMALSHLQRGYFEERRSWAGQAVEGETRMTKTPQDRLLEWARDAHAMEEQAETMLGSLASRIENYPALKRRIEEHQQETRRQAEALKKEIDRLGGGTSALKDYAAKAVALGQGMSGMFVSDEIVKGLLASYTFEHFEIASYRALIATAEACGDQQMKSVCERILSEEEAMAHWLSQHLPQITAEFLQRDAAPGATAKH